MIPKILHMVWVGKAEPPQYFLDNLNKWKDLMPHWTYMVWTNDKLTEEYFDNDYW
jgi:mannosyltransferase OCH1-like enzyme